MYLRLLTCWTAFILTLPSAYAAEYDVFVGNYEGEYISPDGDQNRNRDLSVKIREVKEGFNVSWVTTTFKKNETKEKKYSIDFIETDREHIYEAAQKKNVFGGRDPLDPLKGKAYAWARIKGRTLTTFALTITDDGGYEMQTFDRVLTEDNNLNVRFSRVRDGEVLKTITVTLNRKESGRAETDK